ncbi:MAG: mechanosensitive ion channel family protein [Candidatus Delongbacteria bacterium]|jgi:MscS family membrane protein|nr:mechanosensitive ion channel family protein [Candidatus Delongbacteria bacterium]
MKDFFTKTFYNNTIEDWFYSFLFLIGGFILSKIIYWLFKTVIKKLTSKTKTKLDDILINVIEKPILYAMIIAGAWLGFERLTFTPSIDIFFNHAFTFILIFNITWLIVRAVEAVFAELIIPFTEKSENTFDDQVVPIVRKSIKALLWSLGIIVGLDNAGFDIMALIAGLGIGGLALALAAQDTVKNIFGGIMIFLDKPFRLGDRIIISGHDGFVTEVGIRSTRIKTLMGRIITVPNANFSESSIENISIEPARKVLVNLGLTYDTTPDKMELAIKLLGELVDANQDTLTNDRIISFNNWGDFNLGILFIYYIRKEADILATQSKINLQVLKQFNENGLEFAFPTQTIYKKELT